MSSFILSLFFIYGLFLGSFFNVVGLRVPSRQSITTGRSACTTCLQPLSWYELIPLCSYIIQHGKCRHCHQRIAILYPIIELLTGCLFALSFYMLGFQYDLIGALLLSSLLVIVFVTDITYLVIPNRILLFFMPLFIIYGLFHPQFPWWSSLSGLMIGYLMIAVVILISRGGMGAGDMKLCAVLGFILGTQNIILTFFLACVIGAVVGVLMLMFKVIDRKQKIPFGPYIVVAAIISYYYGQSILEWYVGFALK